METSKTSSEGPQNGRSCCKMVGRRTLCYISTFFILSSFFVIYLTYFRHPPPDELIEMNSRRRIGGGRNNDLVAMEIDVNDDRHVDNEVAELTGRKIKDKGKLKWRTFLQVNNFVPIGEVFDSCDENTRQTLGTVIMVKDEVYGGVKARIFSNFTLPEDVDEGSEVFIDVKYNGNDLYDNHWDLCTVQEGEEGREIYCPVAKGIKSYISDKKIPSYLPKGRYLTNGWMVNQQGETFLCGYTDFIL